MKLLKQSSTTQPLLFLLVSSSDHISGLTGATPTVKLGKNGGTGASPSGTVSEIDSTNLPGLYKVAGNATDTNTLGPLVLHASASGSDPADEFYEIVAFDPQAATNLGLTAIPAIASGSAGALLVDGTGTGAISNSGGKVLLQATQTGVTIPTVTSVGAIATYTGNTPQTGDSFARLGAPAGASTAADIATINAKTTNLPTSPASTTNITAGTIATVSGSVNGNVGGDVQGKVLGGGSSTITAIGTWASGASGAAIMLGSAYTAPDNSDISAAKAVTDKLLTMISLSGSAYIFTVPALANAPTGGGGGGTTRTIINRQVNDTP